MERDDRVVVLGEDVGPLGGVFRATDGLLAQFLEHKRTYRAIRGGGPEGEYVLPLDRASVVRRGQHVTVISWGWVLHETLAAAEQLAAEGIEVEVVDPRTLNPLDTEALLE